MLNIWLSLQSGSRQCFLLSTFYSFWVSIQRIRVLSASGWVFCMVNFLWSPLHKQTLGVFFSWTQKLNRLKMNVKTLWSWHHMATVRITLVHFLLLWQNTWDNQPEERQLIVSWFRRLQVLIFFSLGLWGEQTSWCNPWFNKAAWESGTEKERKGQEVQFFFSQGHSVFTVNMTTIPNNSYS